MRFLKTNTATRVTVGPFLDKTDGITPEVAITVTSCKLTLVVDTGGVPTLVLDTAPTASGGANDMVHVTNDDAGFYDLELAAADVNYVGRAMLAITDVATHCPVFHEFMILSAQAFDAMCGTGNFSADIIAISGDTAAADNAESFFDGTGYAGTNNVIPNVTTTGTATNLTNFPSIPAGWLTVAGIATGALDGKGNWNVGKTGYSLTQAFPANFADMAITLTTGLVSVDKTGYSLTAAYDSAKTAAQAGNQMDLINAPNAIAITAIKTSMEAAGSDLDLLVRALVNKLLITEADGAAELFTDAGVSAGTITACFSSIAGVTQRKALRP